MELAVELGVRPERINTIRDWQAAAKVGARTYGEGSAACAVVVGELARLAARGERSPGGPRQQLSRHAAPSTQCCRRRRRRTPQVLSCRQPRRPAAPPSGSLILTDALTVPPTKVATVPVAARLIHDRVFYGGASGTTPHQRHGQVALRSAAEADRSEAAR